MEELIKRINFLYKKSKEEGLTEEEKKEQHIIRKEYIEGIKGNLKQQLDKVQYMPKDDDFKN